MQKPVLAISLGVVAVAFFTYPQMTQVFMTSSGSLPENDEATLASSMVQSSLSIKRSTLTHAKESGGANTTHHMSRALKKHMVDALGYGQAIGTSTSYCYENNQFGGACWAAKPSNAPTCAADSGTNKCRCRNVECDVPLKDGVTGRCSDRTVYVSHDEEKGEGSDGGVVGHGADRGEETYCSNMVENDKWAENELLATTPANKTKRWLCGSGYTTKEGRCVRKERFLGESCWGSRFSGTCKTGEGEYATACYHGTCVPKSHSLERKTCECSYAGWNLYVLCTAREDACDGHACVWNTGDGNMYCDYGSAQSWHSWW